MNENDWYKINLEKLTESHTKELSEREAREQKARIEVFLHELTGLSNKYGLYIKGCGCCGSPWILDEEGQKTYDDLTYMDDQYMIPDLDDYF